jgi:hypothetical protein
VNLTSPKRQQVNRGSPPEFTCWRFGLFGAVSAGIRHHGEIELATLSRMADLERWGEAVVRGLGWPAETFVTGYRSNHKSACAQVIEDSPLATALFDLMADEPEIRCTATELLAMLNRVKPSVSSGRKGWPSSVQELSAGLRRLAAQFRPLGVDVSFSRSTGGTRLITVHRTRPH